jgi:uncharacterized protein
MSTHAGYKGPADCPAVIPVFPLPGALLLPRGQMPLNIFEPRYLAMVDDCLRTDRIIGMVQPDAEGGGSPMAPKLYRVGCAGRLTQFAETGDGRYLISLGGVCRFRVGQELAGDMPFRRITLLPFAADLEEDPASADVDRTALLRAFRAYLDANDLQADWDSVSKAENAMLVNALSMMAPYGPAEKQALLEAPNLKARAETLIAITEITLARANEDFPTSLQ